MSLGIVFTARRACGQHVARDARPVLSDSIWMFVILEDRSCGDRQTGAKTSVAVEVLTVDMYLTKLVQLGCAALPIRAHTGFRR